MARGYARADEAFDQVVDFLEHFEDLGDLCHPLRNDETPAMLPLPRATLLQRRRDSR